MEDDGAAFDPLLVSAPDLLLELDEKPIGGLGVFLAKRYMDELGYERRGGANCLLMSKSLDA